MTVSLSAVVHSETERWRSSPVTRLPWVAAGYGVLTSALALFTVADPDWSALLAYQNLWVVALGPMLLALIVGEQAASEHAARGGGTWFRPVPAWKARLARLVGLVLPALAVNVLAVVGPLVAGLLLAGPPPVGRIAGSVLVSWLAQLGLIAVLVRVGLRFGRMTVIGVGLVWAGAAVTTAESPYWGFSPFAWTLRGVLPVIGTHANGEALTPGSALDGASVWAPVLAALLLAAVAVIVPFPTLGSRPTGRTRSRSRPGGSPGLPGVDLLSQVAARRPRVVRAMLVVLGRTVIGPLAVAAVGLGALFLRWRSPEESVSVVTLLIVPVGAVVLAVIVRSRVAGGMRGSATRVPEPGQQWVASAGIAATVATVVVLVTVSIYVFAGMPVAHATVLLATGSLTAIMLTTVHLWIAVRTSAGASLAVGIAGSTVGVLVGGTSMQQFWWPYVPWSWGHYLEAERLAFTVPLAVLGTAVALTLLVRSGRVHTQAPV